MATTLAPIFYSWYPYPKMASEEERRIRTVASPCVGLFAQTMSQLRAGPFSNAARHRLNEYRWRFENWAGYSEVFGCPDACLDRWLRRHPDEQAHVLRLLDELYQNLQERKLLLCIRA